MPRRPPSIITRLAWLIAVIGALVGCGYTTQPLFPTEYRSVAVPIFDNRSFYRGLERDVTEALIKELQQRSPYKVVDSGRAQTLLSGTIVSVDQRQLSRSDVGGVPQEVELTVVVDFTWTDQRSGDVIVSRAGFSSVGRYIPTQPVGQAFELAQHAAAARAARDIVSTLRGGW